MRNIGSVLRHSLVLVFLLGEAQGAQAEPVVQDVVANLLAQAVVESQFKEAEFGNTVLDFDARSNSIHEYRLVGTSFGIGTCNDLIIASTNFLSDNGEAVVGNFVLEKQPAGLRVVYQSFGNDSSLARIQTADCAIQTFGVPPLRPTTVVSESSQPTTASAN